MSFWKDLKGFVDKTNESIEEIVDPHLSIVKSKYHSLISQYNAKRSSILDEISAVQKKEGIYKQLLGYQTALLLVARCVHWSDQELFELLDAASHDAPAFDLQHSMFLDPPQAEELTRYLGTSLIVPIFHSSSLRNSLSGDSSLTAIDIATTLSADLISIPTMSPDVFIVDIISQEIEYDKAISRIQENISSLDKTLLEARKLDRDISGAIEDLKISFINSMRQFDRIQEASFEWHLQTNDPDKVYLSAMSSAASQYGLIVKLRVHWKRLYSNTKGQASYLEFARNSILRRDSSKYTAKQVWNFIDLIRQSSESLNEAWEKDGKPKSVDHKVLITEENITYDFLVNVISGSLKGRQFKGSFSYDPSVLKGKGQETISALEAEFNYLSKYTGSPEISFTDGNFERLIWVSGKSTERFGFNAGFQRTQFVHTEEAFIRNGKDYFGYLNKRTFIDGAGTITYTIR